MTYQERRSMVSILTTIAILTGYITYGLSKYNQIGETLLQDTKFWSIAMLITIGLAIIAGIILQIVFHITLSVRNEVVNEVTKAAKQHGKSIDLEQIEIDEVTDERDKKIALKANQANFFVVCIGFVLSLVLGALAVPAGLAMNLVFISFFAGMLVNSGTQVYFYKRGF